MSIQVWLKAIKTCLFLIFKYFYFGLLLSKPKDDENSSTIRRKDRQKPTIQKPSINIAV